MKREARGERKVRRPDGVAPPPVAGTRQLRPRITRMSTDHPEAEPTIKSLGHESLNSVFDWTSGFVSNALIRVDQCDPWLTSSESIRLSRKNADGVNHETHPTHEKRELRSRRWGGANSLNGEPPLVNLFTSNHPIFVHFRCFVVSQLHRSD